MLLLGARLVSGTLRRTAQVVAATVFVLLTLVAGAVDQQINGANPRIYDFQGALGRVNEMARPGDAVVYSPFYLEPVISYYGPDLGARRLDRGVPRDAGRVIVVGSFLDKDEVAAQVGDALADLDRDRRLERELELPQVRVWVYR